MQIEYELTRRVDAPASACWELVTDPHRAPEWITILSSVEVDGELGPGRVIHARGGLLGITSSTRQTVHLWEPTHRYGWRGDEPFPIVVECTLHETDDGTDFEVAAGADPGRFFPAGLSVVRRAVRHQLSRSADRFQRIIEGG